LRWKYRVIDVQKPHKIQIEAIGDFIGRGVWTLEDTPTYPKATMTKRDENSLVFDNATAVYVLKRSK
jgi:hypothetical protein